MILEEQKNSRRSSRRNSSAMASPAPKRMINVVEDNEDAKVRASITPEGETRVEVIDKNEGVITDQFSSDLETWCVCWTVRATVVEQRKQETSTWAIDAEKSNKHSNRS